MASHSDSSKIFGEAISDTTSSVQHANQSVEALMGQLVDGVDGRPRKVDEFQRQGLIDLTIQLKDFGDKSEKFQNDAQEAYGFNTVELRFPRGRARKSVTFLCSDILPLFDRAKKREREKKSAKQSTITFLSCGYISSV
ncbi:uncharacterized protein LOC132756546 [Ruditapes philippinarum]|uniref:uncharacterized protein LOC132756546 n=1 Tax=Ruditapes philippinarum TaxID=129788 RepID=UPI00295B976B|nr:uncharacterized protein LOC132756546 [Ruditapes philippinarum]